MENSSCPARSRGCQEEGLEGPDLKSSDQIADDFFTTNHRTSSECFLGTSGVDFISDEAVLPGIYFLEKEAPKGLKFRFLQAALKNAVLDAGSIVFTNFSHVVKAFWLGYVVGDEGEHF
jgi:hypothetical protein